jgi:hypothetical protein
MRAGDCFLGTRERERKRHLVNRAAKHTCVFLQGQLYDRHASRLPQHDSLHASSVTELCLRRAGALAGRAMGAMSI